MNNIGWYFENALTLTGDFVKKDFAFKAKHLKIRTSNTVTFSFAEEIPHGVVVAADGWVTFLDANKGEIYVKGTGTVSVIAWDGN